MINVMFWRKNLLLFNDFPGFNVRVFGWSGVFIML